MSAELRQSTHTLVSMKRELDSVFRRTVEPQYSGPSVKQPPHYYNHLAQSSK